MPDQPLGLAPMFQAPNLNEKCACGKVALSDVAINPYLALKHGRDGCGK